MNIISVFGADVRACGLTFQGSGSSETDNKSKYPASLFTTSFSTKHALKSLPLDPRRITEIADWRLLPFDSILSPADCLGISMKKTISLSVETRQVLQWKNTGRVSPSPSHLFWLSRNNALSTEYRHIEYEKKEIQEVISLFADS